MNRPSNTFAHLLFTTKLACDCLAPVVRNIYYIKAKGENAHTTPLIETLKEDNSVFTIADGLVQALLKGVLYKGITNVVGEEDATNVNIDRKPYSVGKLKVPEFLESSIDQVRGQVSQLSDRIDPYAFDECTIFIDPIDATREFTTNMGEHCTIMVGFVQDQNPVAGLLYRPIPSSPQWVLGCKHEDYLEMELDKEHIHKTFNAATNDPSNGFLTTNGTTSSFTKKLIEELEMEQLRAGGVGNKIMNLIEGKGICYIQDRGVARWDTAAPQAVLEATGGRLLKLLPITKDNLDLNDESLQYKYQMVKSDELNPDVQQLIENFPEDYLPELTSHNTRDNTDRELFGQKISSSTACFIRPYSNVCGLFAVSKEGLKNVEIYQKAIQRVAKIELPVFC